MAPVLAVDGGQTSCRAVVFEGTRALGRGSGPPYHHHRGETDLGPYAEGPLAAIADLGTVVRGVESAALGLTGLPREANLREALARSIGDASGAKRVILCMDAVIAQAGALAMQPGVVLVVGTGVIGLWIGPDGQAVRSSGRGYLLGDEGSGFAIGQAGLRSAMRHLDGRGGSKALWERVRVRFGSEDELHRQVYGPSNPNPRIASFAEDVLAAAEAGDPGANAIVAEAAADLAIAVLGAARDVQPGASFDVSWTGRLIGGSRLLQAAWREELHRARPEARLRSPLGDALEGARLLATSRSLDVYQSVIGVYEC